MSTLVQASPPSVARARPRPGKWFFAGVAITMGIMVAVGFQRYYFHGIVLTKSLGGLISFHAAAAAAWIALFVVQSLLIVSRQRKIHAYLGWASLVVAAAFVASGYGVAIGSTRARPGQSICGMQIRQFMAIELTDLLTFSAFVMAGVLTRKRPAWHRAMFLMATLRLMPAATVRIAPIGKFFRGFFLERYFGHFLPMICVGALLLLAHFLYTKKPDKPLLVGFGAIVLTCPLFLQFAVSPTWLAWANALLQ